MTIVYVCTKWSYVFWVLYSRAKARLTQCFDWKFLGERIRVWCPIRISAALDICWKIGGHDGGMIAIKVYSAWILTSICIGPSPISWTSITQLKSFNIASRLLTRVPCVHIPIFPLSSGGAIPRYTFDLYTGDRIACHCWISDSCKHLSIYWDLLRRFGLGSAKWQTRLCLPIYNLFQGDIE